MDNINKVFINGNLTRDAELRATQGGSQLLKVSVATNGRRKSQGGEWEDKATFVDCVMFGTRAAGVAPYLPKGTKVSIEGHLDSSSWQAKDGTARTKLEVVIDKLEFMSRGGQQRQQQPLFNAPASDEVYSEDIPF